MGKGSGHTSLLAPLSALKCVSCHSRAKLLFFFLISKQFPLPQHLCISLTSVSAKKEQLLRGPPLISCLISWMNNVPFPSSSGLAGGPQCCRMMTTLRAKTAVGRGPGPTWVRLSSISPSLEAPNYSEPHLTYSLTSTLQTPARGLKQRNLRHGSCSPRMGIVYEM